MMSMHRSIKLDICCIFYFIDFLGNTLPSSNNLFGVMSADLSFIFNHTIIYTDQSDNISQRVVGFNTSKSGGLIADWSFENINPHVTKYQMSLDVNNHQNKGGKMI